MSKIKKIGIDARFFGSQDKGFGRYVQNLILNLETIDKENEYFVFLNQKREREYRPSNSNFKKVLVRHNSLWPLILDKNFKRYKLDLVHFTTLPPPFFYRKFKFIITIHDLTWRFFPPFKNPIKKMVYHLVFKMAIKKAKAIIVPSQNTKTDILNFYKIEPEKIKVIYEGVS